MNGSLASLATLALTACVAVTGTPTPPAASTPVADREPVVIAPPVQPPTKSFADDSAAVAATVNAFHRALESGDSTAALALLEDEVTVLESGGAETRDEYRSHHLPGDIAFARAVRSVRGPMTVRVVGDAAWVTSTSTVQGEYRGRRINSAGAELIVLVRRPGGWRLNAIHWSSRQLRAAP